MVFLDTSPVIYLIEQPTLWGQKSMARISTLLSGGEQLAVSDLVRMECQVGPLKRNDQLMLAKFAVFFASPDVQVLSITGAACDRAAIIRAQYGFKPLDALHLATAVENGCSLFLTNDNRLSKFPDIPSDVLT